jgi:hypothetical protein
MFDKNESDDLQRRRKLDELFADEPFLSPTMKARRLHEKIQGYQEQNGAAQGLPTRAFVLDRGNNASHSDSHPKKERAEGNIPFSAAVDYYRELGQVFTSVDVQNRLIKLKGTVLMTWAKRMPDDL